jgi:hypothetical protein
VLHYAWTKNGEQVKATVELTSKGKRMKLMTDELGDFHGSLPPGEYRLENVFGSSGRSLPIFRDQARQFVIKQKRHTRFDVMIEKRKDTGTAGSPPKWAEWWVLLRAGLAELQCAICPNMPTTAPLRMSL